MASLDNFHTCNGPQPHYPGRTQQVVDVRHSLHSSQSASWDVANAVPVAPVPPVSLSHVDPQVQERLNFRSLQGHYVPTTPRTYARRGDTVEASVQNVGGTHEAPAWIRWWDTVTGRSRARIPTVSRFHPYLR